MLCSRRRRKGYTRFLGVSTHKNEPDVIDAAVDCGVYDVVLTAVNFKQDHYPSVKAAIARAAKAGVGIVGMKTMAGGFLDKEKTKPINCKAALKFVLQDPNVTTTIPGITSFDQLDENASVNQDLAIDRRGAGCACVGAAGRRPVLPGMRALRRRMSAQPLDTGVHACIHVRVRLP